MFGTLKAAHLYMRGYFALRKSKLPESLKAFEAGLEAAAGHKFFTYACNKYIGIAHFHGAQTQQAGEYLRKAGEFPAFFERDSEYFAYMGLIFDSERKLEEARDFYLKAIEKAKPNQMTNVEYLQERLKLITNHLEQG